MSSNDTNLKKEQQHVYPIYLPKTTEKQQFSILNFRETDNVDFTNVPSASIKRENNFRDFKSAYDIDAAPKYGEGSQFGKEQKDEARRKKYGMMARKYNPHDQPWLITLNSGKDARKFKGTKCKDLLDNASYFAFIPDSNGTFTALPIDEWCDCKYLPKYKTLNIDEAEEEFSRRDKVHNKYAIMLNKRLKDETEEAAENKTVTGEHEGSNDDESDEDSKKEKEKSKKKQNKKKAEKKDEEEEGEGVEEGQEVDYITDDSSDEEKKENEGEGNEEEDMNANESDDEEEENKEEEEQNNTNNKNTDSSDTSSDSDIDNDPHLPIVVNKNNQPTKRPHSEQSNSSVAKKPKIEASSTVSQPIQPLPPRPNSSKPITKQTESLEEQVRRYLLRKPMTSKDLIHKLRKSCASKEQLMEDIVAVLMKLNPTQIKVNEKLYFTLKAPPSNDDDPKGTD